MKISKHNTAVTTVTSTDPNRPQLRQVHLTQAFTEATNGRILLRVSTPDQPAGGYIPPTDGILLDPKQVKALGKSTPKGGTIDLRADGDRLLAGTNNTTTILRFNTEPYPKVDQVIPDTEPVSTIQVNLNLLEQLVKATKAACPKQDKIRTMVEFHGDCKPLVLRIEAKDDQPEVTAMIMPLRSRK